MARAVAAQYANVSPVEHVYPLVRSQKQLDRVLDEIEEAPGIVLFTLLEKDLVSRLEGKCSKHQCPEPVDSSGPVMQLFEAYLGAATTGRVGAQHVLNADYFKRIDALNYTVLFTMTASTSKAWKRPTLFWSGSPAPRRRRLRSDPANRGVRTANVPLVPGIPHPHQLESLKKPLVVSLHATPERLIQVRQNRLLTMGARLDRRPVTSHRPRVGRR